MFLQSCGFFSNGSRFYYWFSFACIFLGSMPRYSASMSCYNCASTVLKALNWTAISLPTPKYFTDNCSDAFALSYLVPDTCVGENACLILTESIQQTGGPTYNVVIRQCWNTTVFNHAPLTDTCTQQSGRSLGTGFTITGSQLCACHENECNGANIIIPTEPSVEITTSNPYAAPLWCYSCASTGLQNLWPRISALADVQLPIDFTDNCMYSSVVAVHVQACPDACHVTRLHVDAGNGEVYNYIIRGCKHYQVDPIIAISNAVLPASETCANYTTSPTKFPEIKWTKVCLCNESSGCNSFDDFPMYNTPPPTTINPNIFQCYSCASNNLLSVWNSFGLPQPLMFNNYCEQDTVYTVPTEDCNSTCFRMNWHITDPLVHGTYDYVVRGCSSRMFSNVPFQPPPAGTCATYTSIPGTNIADSSSIMCTCNTDSCNAFNFGNLTGSTTTTINPLDEPLWCYSCASQDLQTIWAATDFPSPKMFHVNCDKDTVVDMPIIACKDACFKATMGYFTGGQYSTYTLRDCQERILLPMSAENHFTIPPVNTCKNFTTNVPMQGSSWMNICPCNNHTGCNSLVAFPQYNVSEVTTTKSPKHDGKYFCYGCASQVLSGINLPHWNVNPPTYSDDCNTADSLKNKESAYQVSCPVACFETQFVVHDSLQAVVRGCWSDYDDNANGGTPAPSTLNHLINADPETKTYACESDFCNHYLSQSHHLRYSVAILLCWLVLLNIAIDLLL